ncbi:MAG TPA: S8 family serine peptidase [Allosphingosinicella sp.]
MGEEEGDEVLHDVPVKPVAAPVQYPEPFLAELLESSRLIRVREARQLFNVDGEGTAVAVLGTGLRTTHSDFGGRVAAQRNFTTDRGGDPGDAGDGHGHGTHVAGIVCAGGVHVGMAPGARIVPLKVLGDDGRGRFEDVARALQWVIDHREAHAISAVCLALGDGGNHRSDAGFADDAIGRRVRALSRLGTVCCIAGGEDYYVHGSAQGMAYPAILRDCVSVGAVYDADEGGFRYACGAEAFGTGPDRIAPFAQRLHEKVGGACATDIFAPGAPMVSSGILGDCGESVQHGTSQATPVVAGIVLLLQSLHRRSTGRLPPVADVRRWLLRGAVPLEDGDDEQDNVLHTGLTFSRVDALASLQACAKDVARRALGRAA